VADLVVAGAGMAGLVAAAQARARGAAVMVLEKGTRAGGSMLLSSGVIWRHRDFEDFRAECAAGEPSLQRILFERLDADIGWLESLGVPPLERTTGNAATVGARFDPSALTAALVSAAGDDIRLGEPLRAVPDAAPLVLATGGFQANRALVREHITAEADSVMLRAAPWSSGDGLRLGLEAGASVSAGLDEFYGRNMPAPPAATHESDFVRLAQLYARHATITNAIGESYRAATWSEIDVVQWTARQPGARAWYALPERRLGERVGARTIGEMIASAEAAGAPVGRHAGEIVVEVLAGITTTLGGLRVDEHAQAAPGVFACGTDAGGLATGGYASGLAAALVFGRIAADAALGV
jgi:fumarate reductase flavoprotein subunit